MGPAVSSAVLLANRPAKVIANALGAGFRSSPSVPVLDTGGRANHGDIPRMSTWRCRFWRPSSSFRRRAPTPSPAPASSRGSTKASPAGHKLTLISAPAGFGKTTVLSEWVAERRRADPDLGVGWVSLDESDNDPVRFLSYLVAAFNAANDEPGPAPIDPTQDCRIDADVAGERRRSTVPAERCSCWTISS